MQALIASFARTEDRMRTHLQSKAMAKALREALAALDVSLSHSQCLELVAKQLGFADWNTLAAKIDVETAPPPVRGDVALPGPIPVLRVDSPEAARAFYFDFLGFAFDWGDEPGSTYAQVSRDGVQLHLGAAGEGQPATLLFRGVRSLDAYHGELAARRARFAPTGIRFTPWDSREFEVTDPFGNRLRFWENNPPGVARPVG